MDQTILAVDDNGNFLEYISKEAGHSGKGKRHLAIAVLLTNSEGHVLLQKRKHQIFDNIWDITGATHPLHKQDGVDESLEEATLRCLRDEWDISSTTSAKGGLRGIKEIGAFNYFAFCGEFCENEHCYLMVGDYDGQVSLNTDMGYEYKWMEKEEFLKDIVQNPQQYTPLSPDRIFTLQKPV